MVCPPPAPLPMQALRKQIMEYNRYKWLLHQTTWWMHSGFPASHPFSFFPHSLTLFTLLSPLSPALYVSVRKLERTWALSHPPIPSLDGYIICLLFLAMTLYSPWQDIKQTTFFPSPSFLFLSALSPSLLFPRCLQWFPFLHYPPEHSVNHDCRGNAWDFQKQTASVPVP